MSARSAPIPIPVPTVPTEGDYLPTIAIAKHFGVHPDTVKNWILCGVPHIDVSARRRVGAKRRNRALRFSIRAVERWLGERARRSA